MTNRLTPIAPEILQPTKPIPLVLLVDHASNHIPGALNGLGLPAAVLDQHIAIDLGAEALARRLHKMLGCAVVIARASRLVLDVNREPDSETLIPEVSDGTIIPGNMGLSAAQKAERLAAYHTPYHAACEAVMQPFLDKGEVPLLVAVHSFTPVMDGFKRPWQVGFLYNRDARLAQALMGFLDMATDLTVGDNQPYSGATLYYTMHRHGMLNGFPQTTLEVRQDLLASPGHVFDWAKLLAEGLELIIDRPDIRFKKVY